MATVERVCVYCGSAAGTDPIFRQAAAELGRGLAGSGIELVYGGGRVGLMGICADAVMASGGRVTGIIPRHLHDVEVGHHGLSELLVVDNMHERKRLMFDRSDAFLVLPGGFGTLDETFEVITWRQLRLHDKPIIVIDVGGYWAPFQKLVEHVVARGFAGLGALSLYRVVPGVTEALRALDVAPEPALEDATHLV